MTGNHVCGRRYDTDPAGDLAGATDCPDPGAHRGYIPVAEIARMRARRAAGRRPLTLAEKMNPGYVRHVADLEDFDGARFEIAADYNTVKIGPYRIARDRMPEFVAAISEAAWQAGVHERTMGEDGNADA